MHHARACMSFEDGTTRDLSCTVLRVGNNAYVQQRDKND